MFSAVHAVLLRPLGLAHQDRLVVRWKQDLRRALPVIEIAYARRGLACAKPIRRRPAVFGSVNWTFTVTGSEKPDTLSMSAVSLRFFDVVGVGALPLDVRSVPQDAGGRQPGAAVISYGLWTRRFAAGSAYTPSGTLTAQSTD